jgi:hypothetical protein
MAPYTPLWVPKIVLKTSLEAKITAENAFSDLGAHTNVVRGALILPLVLVWSRLVDIDFWSFLGHFGVILGSFWVILGSFWGHFGVILGSFWVILGHFGSFWVILGHFEPKKVQEFLKKA